VLASADRGVTGSLDRLTTSPHSAALSAMNSSCDAFDDSSDRRLGATVMGFVTYSKTHNVSLYSLIWDTFDILRQLQI
jgi:hypothetical protein